MFTAPAADGGSHTNMGNRNCLEGNMELSDAKRMKAADREAIDGRGIDSLLLMERAALAVCEAAAEYLGDNRRAAVFCGPGNNGGDGVAAACFLLDRGCSVRVFLVGDRARMTPDTRAMESRLLARGGVLESFSPGDAGPSDAAAEADVIVDALFGVGLSRPLTGDALEAVRLINGAGRPVVSADIPSGVSADTGLILGEAVRAACTVTFSMAKPGHFVEPGCVCRGTLRVTDIGIPEDLLRAAGCGVFALRREGVRLPARAPLTHKGDYGKLLILGGCVGYTGAPVLCAEAALRSGAGLVYLGVPKEIYSVAAVKLTEAMPFPRTAESLRERLDNCDVCVLGPGMGRSEDTARLTARVLREFSGPVTADADALWAIAQAPDLLDNAAGPVVLTPHEGEFARLLGRSVTDRLNDARSFADAHNCAVVLKGHRTICAFPGGAAYVVDAGGPGMARGGSGDVLAGVIGALLGQLPLRRAVLTACWLHARAGDLAADRLGEYAMTAGDIIASLPAAQREIC